MIDWLPFKYENEHTRSIPRASESSDLHYEIFHAVSYCSFHMISETFGDLVIIEEFSDLMELSWVECGDGDGEQTYLNNHFHFLYVPRERLRAH